MNISSNTNKNAFVKQASILAAAGILVRVIGFLYRLPLTGLIGDEGNGIYGVGYSFYNLFLIISSAGLPVAISRMVSERTVLGEYRAANKVFKVSMTVAIAMGLVCALLLGFGARGLSALATSEGAYYTMISLAPTVLIVAVMAVFRGYFQGQGNAVPTAVSQIVEQIFNAAFSLIMAYWFMQLAKGNPSDRYALGAAGGTTGTGIGAFAGLFILVWVYILARPSINRKMKKDRAKRPSESGKKIAVELIKTALPIIAGTAIFSISALIDTGMVMGRLVYGAHFTKDQANALFGILNLKYTAMSTLPVSISTAMATAAIPSIVASIALKDKKAVNEKINSALRLTMLISIPAAIGMGILAEPIIKMLFPNNPEGALLLQVGSISIIFLALAQIVTGMLQAVGKLHIPVIGAVLGAVIKIPLNYFLVAIPEINVLGAVISTIFCYILASFFDWYVLSKTIKIKPDFMAIIIKPLICALIMGLSCYVSHSLLNYLIDSNTIATVFAIALGVVVYFAYMVLMNGITDEDLLRLPMGKRLRSIFRRRENKRG
jgi:stage V sporulation protein B